MGNDVIVVIVVVTALLFDFTNGFHDTANVVATAISTRALPPRIAIGFASLLNFAGAFVSLAVAATVASGIVDPDLVTIEPSIVFSGLIARVEIDVATTLAVSWKPFVKSKASAVATTITTIASLPTA